MKGIVSYYNKILGKTKYGILFITVLGMLVSLLMTGSALITEALIDAAEKSAETGQMSRELISCIIAYGIFIVVVLSIEVLYSYINSVIKNKTELSLRARILGVVLSRDYSTIQRYHSGDILNRATNDVSVVVTGLVQSLPEFIMTATRIVSAFVVLYRMNKYFALILLLVAPVTLLAASFYGKKVKKLHLRNQKCEGENRAFMTEAIQNMTVIKACDNVAPITGYFAKLQSTSYKLRMKSAVMGIVAGVMMFLSVYVLYYIALMWGAYGMVNEVVGFGTLTAMLQLVVQFQAPFKNISAQINQLFKTAASAGRIRQLEEIPDDLPSEYVSGTDGFEGITIKDLTFSYTDAPVIEGLNAEIRAGEFVGIGGPSGTGKSTLLKLIMGLLNPTSGSIEIEGGVEDRRGLFSYVPQGNMVLSGSIKDNISRTSSAPRRYRHAAN